MAVYEPHSRPEDKWGHWEDPEYIKSRYGFEAIETHLKIQEMLKAAGLIGIPNCSGGGNRWNEGLWIVSREHEFELSKAWYEDGELFGENADQEYETVEIWGEGTDRDTALAALVKVVEDYIANGPLKSQLAAAEAAVENQSHRVIREERYLWELEGKVRALKDQLENKP